MREITLPACFIASLWIWFDSDGNLGVKSAYNVPVETINLESGDGNGSTIVEIGVKLERTTSPRKTREYHIVKVSPSDVSYEVDPSADGLTVTVVPTFWGRLINPNTLLSLKKITIHVPTEAEAFLLKEFFAQGEYTIYRHFREAKGLRALFIFLSPPHLLLE